MSAPNLEELLSHEHVQKVAHKTLYHCNKFSVDKCPLHRCPYAWQFKLSHVFSGVVDRVFRRIKDTNMEYPSFTSVCKYGQASRVTFNPYVHAEEK